MQARTPTHLGGKVSLGLEVFEGGRQQEGGEKEECGPEEDIRDERPSLAAGRADESSMEVDAVLERRRRSRRSSQPTDNAAATVRH